ncbi:MAG TPA: portal protein, partial [Steroidobacteraceae bacterium]|nr:portal protein [Steroidobacteraceae bacterium]
IAKMVDPPLVGPPALRASKTSLLPGDITYADEREGMKGLRSIHDVNLRIDHLAADINDVQYRIDRAYYADLFLMMARSDQGQPITAREVEERHEEKLLALGPVLERTNDELLDPLVDRVYSMMELAGLIPPVPEALNGVKLRVEYISIMAQAQKMVGVVQQDRFMQTMLGLQPVFNGVSMKVKINDVVDTYADMLGIDPSLVRTNEEADALAAEAAKAMQAQQEADVMKTQAQAIQAAGTTPMDGGETALTRVADASQAVM